MKWFGLLPFLMEEAGDGGGGAVATIPSGAVATTEPAGGDTTAVEPAGGDGAGDGTTATPARQSADAPWRYLREKPEYRTAANNAQRAIAFGNSVRQMFPGQNPITAIENLQRDLRSLAGDYATVPDPRDPDGRTGIEQIRDSLAELEQADLLFYSADPALFDAMTADEEGKAAFAKLIPFGLAKMKAIAPNAYRAMIAKEFLEELKYSDLTDDKGNPVERADIPLRVRRMYGALVGRDEKNQLAILEKPDSVTLYNEIVAISNLLDNLEKAAKLAPEKFNVPAETDTKLSDRERRIAEREEQNKQRDFLGARQRIANAVVQREWNKLTAGWEISPEDRDDVLALYHTRLDQMIRKGEPGILSERKRFYDANDIRGMERHEEALQNRYTPKAMKMEVDKLIGRLKAMGKKPKGGAAAKPGAEPAARPGAAPVAVPQGFIKLNEKPHNNDLDFQAMQRLGQNEAREMVLNHRGILRAGNSLKKPAGTKVQWPAPKI